MQPGQKSNVGTWAAVLGGVVAIGGVAAAALASGNKKAPRLSGPRRPALPKKPCGCGR